MARVPFDSTKKLVCVEYPGMVKDPEKVLATLGGVETISKTVADANRRLELRLRPNDVYCKPTCADRVATNHVLLRVRRKKRKGASAKTTNNGETLNLNGTNGPAPDRGSSHHASPLTSANLPPSEVDDDDDVQCSIIGIIDTTYKFQSMCDYQFLPAKSSLSSSLPQNGFSPSNVEAKGKREWQPITSDLVVRELVNSTWLDKPAPLFLPPPIFSRQDTPVEYLYRPEPKHRTNKVNKDSHPPSNVRSDKTESVKATSPWEKVETAAMSSKREASAPNVNLIGVARQRRAGYTVFVNFEDINVPASAIPEAVKTVEARLHDDRDRARLKHLRRLFDERPVWSKNALKCNVDIAPDKLKMMLPVVAYYFLTGPWRSLWVRLGYDPRRDPLAKKYQLVDFRIRQRSAADRICIKSKRSTYSYSLPNTVQKAQPQVVRILQEDLNLETVDVTTANQQDADDQQRKKESIYVFRHGILPPFRQMFYQLCDIFDDDVQRLVLDNEGEELSRGCTEKDGWCVEGMQDKARDIISGRLKELMKKEGIETQARKNSSTKAKDQKQKGKAVAKTTTKGKTHSENPKLDSSELDDELEDAKGSEDQNLDSSEFDEVFGEKGKALMKSTTTFKGEVSCEDRKLDLSELDEEDLNFEEEEDDMDLTGFTESSERDTPMEDDEEWLP